jgi:3-methyladenine DNA glycosylase AlkD
MTEILEKRLAELADGNEAYALFQERIINTGKKIIGVRTPDIRKLAKEIAKDMDAKAARAFLRSIDTDVYEQVVLAGFVINRAKLSDAERISLVKSYIAWADSWALVDLFAEKMKHFDRELWWDFATGCLSSGAEFTVRLGVLLLAENFADDEHIAGVFAAFRGVTHEGYYVKMALAWMYSAIALRYYEETLAEVMRPGADAWTSRKALTKMLESRRFTDEQKEHIRSLRAGLK